MSIEPTLILPTKPVLSLCMIVKNEIQNLPRCLASVKPYVDEIVVIDTGSQDGTQEVALQYGAKVKYFEWCDDFAAARNYSISQASGDWILTLDADEELVVHSEEFLDEITQNSEVVAYTIAHEEVNDRSKSTPYYRISLFRNLSDFKYSGRFHERLVYQNQTTNREPIRYLSSLSVVHYGSSKEELRQKNISRNIPMLERLRQEGNINLRLLYCLASMYADTQQPEKAQDCSREVFERLFPHLVEGNPPSEFAFVPDMLYVMGAKALQQQDYETAMLICQRGLEWCPNFPPLNYLAGATLRALGLAIGAVAYFENCIRLGQEDTYYKGEPFEQGYMTIYPAYDLGCVYLDLKREQEALAALELALAFDANFTVARQKIDEIIAVLNDS